MTLFQKKYRIESIRKPDWDYSGPGSYFITICTKDKKSFFGRVIDGQMDLSTIGKCAENHWRDLVKHFNYVTLDDFVVMPNHFHGIIDIARPDWNPKVTIRNQRSKKKSLEEVSPKAGSLSHVLRCYKAGVSFWCKEQGLAFGWHIGFYDRIIREPSSLPAIRDYIRENPMNWEKDVYN